MESVNGTLKVECVNNMHFATRDEARQAIVEYVGYYHAQRRHSLLGNIAPAEFERRWRAGIEPEEQGLALVGPHCAPTAGSRFVASNRTGHPWITLIVLCGVH